MPDYSDISPALSSSVAQSGVADAAGTIQYQPTTDSSTAGEIAFAGPTADFMLYGVVNGAFAQGPPDSSQNIEPVNNPLPYWYGPVQVSGGAITATWVADSASPSGYNLRFTINPGAAGDEAYFEQIVPIGGTRSASYLSTFADVYRVTATDNGFLVFGSLQCLTASGTTTGSSTEDTQGFASDAQLENVAPARYIPSDAAYVRLRIGVRRSTAATTASGSFDFIAVRGLLRTFFDGTFPDSNGSTTPASISQSGGTLSISAAGTSVVSATTTLVTIPIALTTSKLTASAAVIASNIIAPTLAANANDYAPTGLATCAGIYLTVTGATRTITGFSATGFTEGQIFWIHPVTNSLVLAHSSASSAAGNRIGCPGAVDLTIRNGGGVQLVYTPANAVNVPFRVIGAV